MSHAIIGKGYILDISDTVWCCPSCGYINDDSEKWEKLAVSKRYRIKSLCKACADRVWLYFNHKGDFVPETIKQQ